MALQMRLSQRERGGCFRDRRGCGREHSVGAGTRLRRGRRFFGLAGAPKVFYVVSLSSRPVAVDELAARPVRGAAEGAFRALGGLALSFAILLSGTLALAYGVLCR